jgi:hypothetical protein
MQTESVVHFRLFITERDVLNRYHSQSPFSFSEEREISRAVIIWMVSSRE